MKPPTGSGGGSSTFAPGSISQASLAPFGYLSGIAVGPTTAGAQTQVTVPVPPSAVNGDLLIACVGASVTPTSVPATIAGWNVAGAPVLNSNGNHATVGIFWRVASSEPASYNFTWTGGAFGRGAMLAFHGLPIGAIDTNITAYLAAAAASLNSSLTGAAAVPNGEVVVGFITGDNGAVGSGIVLQGVGPVTFDASVDPTNPVLVAQVQLPSPATGGTPKLVWQNVNSQVWAAGIIAVK